MKSQVLGPNFLRGQIFTYRTHLGTVDLNIAMFKENWRYYIRHPFKYFKHWWSRRQVPGPVVSKKQGLRLMVDSGPQKFRKAVIWMEKRLQLYPAVTHLVFTTVAIVISVIALFNS
jgi:hypothetical protein